MVRLYLVRHGQTAWNAEGRYQGQLDVPLDDVGRAQALALRPRLAGVPFAAAYTSMLSRAHETAALVLGDDSSGSPRVDRIERLAALNEMSYGEWETHTREEIVALFADNWREYMAAPDRVRPVGGETRTELYERVAKVLREIVAGHATGAQVLIAAHGGTLRVLLLQVLNLPMRAYHQLAFDNASLSIVDIAAAPASGMVLLLNDTAHLEPVKAMPEDRAL